MKWILGLVVLVAAVMVYVRMAPSDAEAWHVVPAETDAGDHATPGSFTAVRAVTGDPDALLARIDEIAMATPRTTRLAGTPEEGMITYVTRSRIMGFPDYTTVHLTGTEAPHLAIHARLRFGQSDMGVNRARVEAWLDRLPDGMIAAS